MKKLKKIKLGKVNGGLSDAPNFYMCPKCKNPIVVSGKNERTTGSGCDTKHEYYCDSCSQWFSYDD